jgi:hypothetical protein
MIDTSANTFARRARLSTAAIALAVAVTLAAAVATVLSSGKDHFANSKLESPISDAHTHTR